MSTDDRTETITDPAEIRATDEPDERTPNEVHVDESGCSCKTGPYRGFQRDPIDAACPKHGGPLRHGDGDVTVCHPDGSTTIIREPDERGDFPCCTTPAPVGAAVALDLDAVHETICDNFTGMAEVRQAADALVAEVRRLAGIEAHRDNLAAMIRRLSEFLDGRGLESWKHGACWAAEDAIKTLIARAESAEAEVGTLRANWRHVTKSLGYGDGVTEPQIGHVEFVAECERQFSEASEWRESQRWRDECHDAGHPDDEDCYEHDPALVLLTLRAKVAAVEAVERGLSEGWVMLATVSDRAEFVRTFRAALATTGEGE